VNLFLLFFIVSFRDKIISLRPPVSREKLLKTASETPDYILKEVVGQYSIELHGNRTCLY
jgi:hypothetical protein